MTVGGIAVATRNRIIRAFGRHGAFSEGESKNLKELGLQRLSCGIFKHMLRKKIIIKTNDDRYYMDKMYCERLLRRTRIVRPIALAFLFVIIALIAGIVFCYFK